VKTNAKQNTGNNARLKAFTAMKMGFGNVKWYITTRRHNPRDHNLK